MAFFNLGRPFEALLEKPYRPSPLSGSYLGGGVLVAFHLS